MLRPSGVGGRKMGCENLKGEEAIVVLDVGELTTESGSEGRTEPEDSLFLKGFGTGLF